MTVVEATRTGQRQAIHGVNPVAKLIAAMVIGFSLLLTIDPVSAAVALVLEAILLVWAGLSFREFFVRTAPLWVAVPLTGLTTALYGVDSGAVHWTFGFVSRSEEHTSELQSRPHLVCRL